MRMLTAAEHDELLEARRQRDMLMTEAIETPAETLVERLLMCLAHRGLVLTVEQVPLQPLAMGNYRTAYSLRHRREAA